MRRYKPKPQQKVTTIPIEDRICRKCVFAYLMRRDETNPIVSMCTKTKERFVASTPHSEDCGFKENVEECIIHEMIPVR